MPTGPREPDHGTGPAGPLERVRTAAPAPDEGWRAVPGKPYLQENVLTGRMRTKDYQPTTPLKE